MGRHDNRNGRVDVGNGRNGRGNFQRTSRRCGRYACHRPHFPNPTAQRAVNYPYHKRIDLLVQLPFFSILRNMRRGYRFNNRSFGLVCFRPTEASIEISAQRKQREQREPPHLRPLGQVAVSRDCAVLRSVPVREHVNRRLREAQARAPDRPGGCPDGDHDNQPSRHEPARRARYARNSRDDFHRP